MNSKLNDVFFGNVVTDGITYEDIWEDVQRYCTEQHTSTLSAETDKDRARELLLDIIGNYLIKRKYVLEGYTTEALCERLYEDMAGISFLKQWIYNPNVEEVNINRWDDIEVIMSGGRSMKIPEKFQSPSQALDVIRRMLSACGMIIDDTMPSVLGYLSKRIRISVDKAPLVDADAAIDASIRIVNQQSVSDEKMLAYGSATKEMLDFLSACIRYGVSVCIAGATGSGKTTVMAWLLSKVPNNRRLITIEEGSREFDLVKRDADGNILNSVVHLLTRPHENAAMNIDQSFLLERVLRKHPDVIGVGEMRSAKEAMAAAEASRTGHTVVTTIHSNSASATYRRMMTLAKLKNAVEDDILMQIMVEAYPIVIYTKQLLDGSRKIMEIIEGEDYVDGQLQYHTLYRYDVEDNRIKRTLHTRGGTVPPYQIAEAGDLTPAGVETYEDQEVAEVVGHHTKVGNMSDVLRRRFLDNGIPARELQGFLKEGC